MNQDMFVCKLYKNSWKVLKNSSSKQFGKDSTESTCRLANGF